jgi:hypothetical protein
VFQGVASVTRSGNPEAGLGEVVSDQSHDVGLVVYNEDVINRLRLLHAYNFAEP